MPGVPERRVMEEKRARHLSRGGAVAAVVLLLAFAAYAASNIAAGRPPLPHRDVACTECHLSPQVGTLVDTVLNLPDSERGRAGTVPDEHCQRCHPSVKTNLPGFSHAVHASKGPCIACHPEAGHSVSPETKAAAGRTIATSGQVRSVRLVAGPDAGQANLPNHPSAVCERCHDMAATPCSTCHTAPGDSNHAGKPDCATCHKPGATFTFTHPVSKAATATCDSCHEVPKKHSTASCTTCHKTNTTWEFTHPGASAKCVTCHARPAKHAAGSCTTCHPKVDSWAFQHPKGKTACTSCHRAPSGHYPGACSRCHSIAVAFKSTTFKHTAATRNCTQCHNRPASHTQSGCASCHSTGQAWSAAPHPSSNACAKCHNAPRRHYGSNCASCHKASAAFSSAVFRHPGASASCTKCHSRPSGHPRTTCTSCHKVGKTWAASHPLIEELRTVPPRSVAPFRVELLVVPQGLGFLEECQLPASVHRRALVPKLQMRELPSERVLLGDVQPLPRQRFGSPGRLSTRPRRHGGVDHFARR